MLRTFDHADVMVQCPHCDQQVRETVGLLREGPMLTCPKCETRFRYRVGLEPGLLARTTTVAVGDFA